MTWIILQLRGKPQFQNQDLISFIFYHIIQPCLSTHYYALFKQKKWQHDISPPRVCHCSLNFAGTLCTSGWLSAGFLFVPKLGGTIQFSSDDMMLFLTFRPSLFVKICSCQRKIQSHLTDRLWLDWIRFATFHELVERFPR